MSVPTGSITNRSNSMTIYTQKRKVCCIKCKRELAINMLSRHVDSESCKSAHQVNSTKKSQYPCQHCKKLFKFLPNHIPYCQSNPNKIKRVSYTIGHTPWNYGLTKLTDERIKNATEKCAKTKQSLPKISRKWSDEEKRNHSSKMKQVVLDNPHSYNGTTKNRSCKIYEYNGTKLTGTWEVMFAMWCDEHKIIWERPTTPIPYVWNGNRLYYPDFYLPEYDFYIEVKGRKTDRDEAKWAAVKNLLVIEKHEIHQIKNRSYVLPLTIVSSNQA